MNFIRCNSKDELAQKIANEFKNVITINPKSNLGLATGSSPLGVYDKLIKMYKNNEISFKDVRTFNLDEYLCLNKKYFCNSYYEFMKKNLFNEIDIKKENINFPCRTLWEAENNYEKYDDLILENGGLDILILGLGSNGHIGFNEPGSKKNSKTRIIKLADSTRKDNARFFDNDISYVPEYAVTMGLSTIISAKKIILIVLDDNKKKAFEVLKNSVTFDEKWPCTILNEHKDVSVYYLF